jgi:hypothetical protein
MARNVQVVEDALVESSERSRASTPRVWIVVALVVGIGFGAVFFGPVVGPTLHPPAGNPDTAVAPGDPIGPVGVSEALPGFPDAIVGITESQASGTEYMLGPQARGPSTRSIPVDPGRPVRIDASGVWLALTHEVPDAAGDLLSVGRATGVNPAVSGVGSFAWHDSAHGAIGFIRFHEGRWGLWRSPVLLHPQLVADLAADDEPRLMAWGDWGWAISQSGRIDVLAPNGGVIAVVDGLVLGSGPRGLLVSTDAGVGLVEAAGGLAQVEMPDSTSGTPTAGAMSPDGTRAAVLTSTGVAVVGLDGDESGAWYRVGAGRAPVSWSSDSRFVLVPLASRGMAAIDPDTGDVELVLEDMVVRWIGVIPLSRSS